jgi:signal transduction histidine kinase
MVYVAWRFKEILDEVRSNANEVVRISEEKKAILANQNTLLEKQVDERTKELHQSLQELKSTQSQLIQAEKMASLGELTAGIAHEIQNPLNFVNNFSEVSSELLEEMKEEIRNGNLEEVNALSDDVIQNLEKILTHGRRADGIVKGMLQHSRGSSGEKEPTDLNALADEYLRLSYHGLRARDKSFTADFKLDADEALPKVNVVPQDIGRVLLNLINNAFYAVSEKAKQNPNDYKPTVTVSTTTVKSPSGDLGVEIRVKDNGPGIPYEVKKKIFQPFFTTKPTGQGTGLGLSMSFDIVKAHGGKLSVESKEGEGTEFAVQLPIV